MTHFLHLSDLHFRVNYEPWYLADFHRRKSLTWGLRSLIDGFHKRHPRPDFIVLSGDLTHEGEAEDYRELRSLLDQLPVPHLVALGNHDRRGPFREGFLGLPPTEEPYDREAYFDGLRIITLDSSVPGSENGQIDGGQYSWLKDRLTTRSERGTLLVLHHPPSLAGGRSLENGLLEPASMRSALEGSDVLGILSGHAHRAKFSSFAGLPHFTAGSLAFGARMDRRDFFMTDEACFNVCRLDSDGLSAYCETCAESLIYGSIPMERLMANMEASKA